jgi:hypothetical protein
LLEVRMPANPPILRALCPTCKAERNAFIKAETTRPWDDAENHERGRVHHRVLECCGCETRYFQEESVSVNDHETYYDSELDEHVTPEHRTVTLYPRPALRGRPVWAGLLEITDETLGQLLSETYTVLDYDLRVLAAVGARTTFDRATEVLGIDPAISFNEKLNVLLSVGEIGQGERDTLSTLTDAGNAAAHRGWRPTNQQINLIMSTLEAFLHRCFVMKGAMERLKQKIPSKQARKSARKKDRVPPP